MVIFSFFSGVGMLDLGFQNAGFNIEFVNEFNEDFLESYIYARTNEEYEEPRYGYHLGDINELITGAFSCTLKAHIDDVKSTGELIGFIGGPPCPDFSVGGKNKGRDGSNGKLAKSYIDAICKYKPDFFLFENVKGLIKTQRHREYFDELKQTLIESGYFLSEELLNALSFGVPQDRDRIILIGVLANSQLAKRIICQDYTFVFPWKENLPFDANEVKKMKWPLPQQYLCGSRRKFKYDLPQELTVEYWFVINDVKHHCNCKDVFNVRSGINKISSIKEGDTSRKSFKRLHRWKYSPTAAYGNNEVHLHPYKTRRLSVAEAMAIQSLPKWFELPDDIGLSSKFKMIGNGVPYLMALEIAKKIQEYLIGGKDEL